MNQRRGTSTGRWILRAALLAFVVTLLLAPFARASTDDIIAPSDPHAPAVDSGWQAGTCNAEPPAAPTSARSPPRTSSSKPPPPTRNWGFTQFIVKHRRPPGGADPVGELKTVRVELPVGLSVNPGATDRCPLATFEAGATGCPPGSKVGESVVTARRRRVTFRRRRPPADQSPRLQRRPEARARPRASGSNWPATKSSSKATSPGRATTTRASRSRCPQALPLGAGSKA